MTPPEIALMEPIRLAVALPVLASEACDLDNGIATQSGINCGDAAVAMPIANTNRFLLLEVIIYASAPSLTIYMPKAGESGPLQSFTVDLGASARLVQRASRSHAGTAASAVRWSNAPLVCLARRKLSSFALDRTAEGGCPHAVCGDATPDLLTVSESNDGPQASDFSFNINNAVTIPPYSGPHLDQPFAENQETTDGHRTHTTDSTTSQAEARPRIIARR